MPRPVCVVVFLVPLLGCTTQATPDAPSVPPTDDSAAPELSWYRDAAPIVAARCAGCHNAGGIAPFPLTTHDEVVALAQPIAAAVASGSMPPWQGADGCNEYSNDFSLTDDEQAMLLSWIDAGAPEGNPEDAVSAPALSPLDVDVVVTLPEPYTPVQQPDDYRCQLIEWPAEERRWITGMEVLPDQRSVVHHAIAFAVGAADAEAFREMDSAEDGPGYTCFGGPTSGEGRGLADMDAATLLAAIESGELAAGLGSTRWLGAWVPGVQATALPAGTGLRMDPGDRWRQPRNEDAVGERPVGAVRGGAAKNTLVQWLAICELVNQLCCSSTTTRCRVSRCGTSLRWAFRRRTTWTGRRWCCRSPTRVG